MLPRVHRLRRSADIRQVRRRGHRRGHSLLLLFAYEKKFGKTRFAVALSGRVGNAVVRNRAKRRIREAVRHRLREVRDGWDCVFVARPAVATASFPEIDQAVQQLLTGCGVLDRRHTE